MLGKQPHQDANRYGIEQQQKMLESQFTEMSTIIMCSPSEDGNVPAIVPGLPSGMTQTSSPGMALWLIIPGSWPRSSTIWRRKLFWCPYKSTERRTPWTTPCSTRRVPILCRSAWHFLSLVHQAWRELGYFRIRRLSTSSPFDWRGDGRPRSNRRSSPTSPIPLGYCA